MCGGSWRASRLWLACFMAGIGWSARWRGPRAFGSVVVRPYYAVPLKDGKTEFMMLSPETRTCVHSLFPTSATLPAGISRATSSSASTCKNSLGNHTAVTGAAVDCG
jgi:hypothetical protein